MAGLGIHVLLWLSAENTGSSDGRRWDGVLSPCRLQMQLFPYRGWTWIRLELHVFPPKNEVRGKGYLDSPKPCLPTSFINPEGKGPQIIATRTLNGVPWVCRRVKKLRISSHLLLYLHTVHTRRTLEGGGPVSSHWGYLLSLPLLC